MLKTEKDKNKHVKKKQKGTNKVLFVSRKGGKSSGGAASMKNMIEGIEVVVCKNLSEADDKWSIDEENDSSSFAALVYSFDESKKLRKGEKDAKDPQAFKAALMQQESKIIAFMSKILRLRKDAFVCILFINPDNITAARRTALLQGG